MGMIFHEALKDTLSTQKTRTENGAFGFVTSKSALVDFHYKTSSFRDRGEDAITNAFADAYNENPILAMKLLFLTGDIRQGLGERRTFRTCLKWLADFHADTLRKVLPLIPEYARWDILVDLLGTSVDAEAFDIIKAQLDADVANCESGKPISLLAKWLPSVNTSSKQSRSQARSLCARMRLTERLYRKKLSKLRAYSNVVEVKMSANQWTDIDYSKVPSQANILYRTAYMKHDSERRGEFLESVKNGETKINSSVSFPHNITHSYFSGGYQSHPLAEDDTLEAMWKALPNYVGDKGADVLCVVDGSGSMDGRVGNTNLTRHDIARGIGIYFSERMQGQLKDKYITFSENPKYVDLSKFETLHDKLVEACRHTEYANTNIHRVFDLILQTGKSHKLTQDEMPAGILIISDMEFDGRGTQTTIEFKSGEKYESSSVDKSFFEEKCKALFEEIGQEYADAGYKLPKLIFWNVCSTSDAIPLQENDCGVILVSGFSPSIADMVFSQKTNPYDVLVDKLNSARYKAVGEALA